MTVLPLGLLGGSFDPVHRGHLAMAEAARVSRGLREIRFVPAAASPFKAGENRCRNGCGDETHGRHRLRMLELAVEGRSGYTVSTIELDRGGASYTVETAEALVAAGEGPIEFIIGADNLTDLSRWRGIDRLFRLATVVCVDRPGYAAEAPPGLPVVRVVMAPVPVSSSEIRRRVARGEPIEEMVPAPVAEYICRHGLYRDTWAQTGREG